MAKRRVSKASQAYNSTIELEYTCVDVTMSEWESLMEGAVKANGSKIRAMIKKQLPELYNDLALQFYNPYEQQSERTDTHLIYVSSAIEYFLKIN